MAHGGSEENSRSESDEVRMSRFQAPMGSFQNYSPFVVL